MEYFMMKKIVLSLLLVTGTQYAQATILSSLFNVSVCIIGLSNVAEIWLGSKNPFKTNLLTIEKKINNTAEKTVYSILPNIGMKTENFLFGRKISETKWGFWLTDNNNDSSSSIQTKMGCSILPLSLIAYGLKQFCNR